MRLPKVKPNRPLASRWTEKQIEKAHKIVNDIAEFVDCGESRTELRRALAIYADLLWDADVKISDKRSSEVVRLAKKLEKTYRLLEKQPA